MFKEIYTEDKCVSMQTNNDKQTFEMKDVQYVLIGEGLFTARSTRIGTNICQIIGQFIIKNQIKKQIKIKFKNYI